MIMPLAAPAGPSAIVWRPSTVCQRCLRSCQPHPARDRSTMPWRPTRTRASDPQSGLLGDGAVTCGVCRPDGSGAASRRREIPMSFPTACRGTNRSADTRANRSARLAAGPAAGSGGGGQAGAARATFSPPDHLRAAANRHAGPGPALPALPVRPQDHQQGDGQVSPWRPWDRAVRVPAVVSASFFPDLRAGLS